eukprot:scaffold9484_cov124-Isochrysis_galbana.AAC.29
MAAHPGAPSAGNPAATAKGTLIPWDRAWCLRHPVRAIAGRGVRCTGRVQRQRPTLGRVAVLCPCLIPSGWRPGRRPESDGGQPHGPLPRVPQVAGRRLPSPQADWQAADCTGLAPVHVQPQHGSHSVTQCVQLCC